MSKRKWMMVLLLAASSAGLGQPAVYAQDAGAGGDQKHSDPTASAVGDPHGAIRAMSKASEPGGKPDHAKTTIPDNVIPGARPGK
jgi:hypothetical protein